MTEKNSIATGDALTPATWADFVQRLRYHCKGEGVREHCTADAIFIVEAKRLIYGIEPGYTDNRVVIHDDSVWFSPQEYWEDADEEERAELHRIANEEHATDDGFLSLDADDQWCVLGELEDHTVTGWDERWEYVNSHFTKEAAEAFIRRKKHDYPHGLRINVDAQLYCWEWNAIKAAIMDGRLVLADQLAEVRNQLTHWKPRSQKEMDACRKALETTDKLISGGAA